MSTTNACPICDTPRFMAPGELWARCAGCQAMLFTAGAGPSILVAHDQDDVALDLCTILQKAGFAPLRATGGVQALSLARKFRPQGACIDVALTDVSTPQVIETLRADANLAGMKVILIASVFNKMAYKRRPSKLYGADDSIEHHQAAALLAQKMATLLGVRIGNAAATGTATVSALLRVHALAYSIVADIVLSNQEAVEAAIQTAALGDMTGPLDEGRRLLAEMASPSDFDVADPIGSTFDAFLDGIRRVRQ